MESKLNDVRLNAPISLWHLCAHYCILLYYIHVCLPIDRLSFYVQVKKCRGRIVNTTSIAGRFVLPASGPYCCSKYAAEAYSDGLR